MSTGVYFRTKEHCKNISISKTGKKLSEEHKRKIGESNKGKNTGKDHWNWKDHITPEYIKEQKRKERRSFKAKLFKNPALEKEWREKKRKKDIEWNKQHREYRNYLGSQRRAKDRESEGSFTLEAWIDLKKYYDYKCKVCKKPEPQVTLCVDHIMPISKGGSNYIENIQPLCKSCNSRKGNKLITLLA